MYIEYADLSSHICRLLRPLKVYGLPAAVDCGPVHQPDPIREGQFSVNQFFIGSGQIRIRDSRDNASCLRQQPELYAGLLIQGMEQILNMFRILHQDEPGNHSVFDQIFVKIFPHLFGQGQQVFRIFPMGLVKLFAQFGDHLDGQSVRPGAAQLFLPFRPGMYHPSLLRRN